MRPSELLYLGFSIVAAALAAYGTLQVGGSGPTNALLALIVFLGAVALMIRGIAAMRSERLRHQGEQRALNSRLTDR